MSDNKRAEMSTNGELHCFDQSQTSLFVCSISRWHAEYITADQIRYGPTELLTINVFFDCYNTLQLEIGF